MSGGTGRGGAGRGLGVGPGRCLAGRAQVIRFAVASGGHLGRQVAEHNGGCVRASTMDRWHTR
jgi:hypothetical protein